MFPYTFMCFIYVFKWTIRPKDDEQVVTKFGPKTKMVSIEGFFTTFYWIEF